MTQSKIRWLLPSTPESLLMLDDPVEGLRPKWLAPGATGDVLQIDDLGRLAWGQSPATMTWPLLAPDGVVTAPSYAFADAPEMGMFREADDQLSLVGADGARLFLTTEADPSWGLSGIQFWDALNGYLSSGSWGGTTPTTAFGVVAPSQTEYFQVNIRHGSGVVAVSGSGQLDLHTVMGVAPYTEARWNLKPDGTLTLPGPILALDGTAAAPSYSFASNPAVGLYFDGTFLNANLTESASWYVGGTPEPGVILGLTSPAGELWFGLDAVSGGYIGTGTADRFGLYANGALQWSIPTTGHYLPAADNAQDLGDPTHQIRDLYLSGQIYIDGVPGGGGGVTYPLLAPDGTAAAPSYAFAGAPTTGIGRHIFGGNELSFLVAGAPYAFLQPNAFTLYESALWFNSDNAHDIGAAPANFRPRSIYFGTQILAPDGTAAVPSYSFASDPDNGLYWHAPNIFGLAAGGTLTALVLPASFSVSILDVGLSGDLFLARDAPGILAQRNGANAQTFRVYEAYTDASNWSALELGGASTMTVLSRPTGTGLARALRIGTVGVAPVTFTVGNANVWYIEVDNSFNPLVANADIGNDGMRVRSLFIGSGTNLKALAAAPATPPATSVIVYAKTDKKVYAKDDAGVETLLTANNPMTTVGDLIVGSTAGAPARLAAVAAGAVLASAGVGVAPAWSTAPSLAGLTLTARFVQGQVTVTYSASMTIDASLGNEYIITATNGTAFTIVAPTNPVTGQRITVRIRNTTGSTLGAATWNAVFKMSAWTQPATATSRAITFAYNGTNWVEVSRTTVDVPN